MKRTQLVRARAHKHWTMAQAAEHLQVDINTLFRWEHGTATPYPYNVERLCQVYGATAADLGLEEKGATDPMTSAAVVSREQSEPMLPLDIIASLQWLVVQETEEKNAMHSIPVDPMSRRDALRRLALLPIEFYGLSALEKVLNRPIEEILPQCAAGIVACQYLGGGQHEDLALASTALASYLPTLKSIVKDASGYRRQAAGLAAQALMLMSTLGVHTQGPQYAARLAEQAVSYSKESGDLPLHLMVLRRLAWIYGLSRQKQQAVAKVLQAEQLLQQSKIPVVSSIQWVVYSGLAKYQAQSGNAEDALVALRQAQEAFTTSSEKNENYSYNDFNHSNLLLDGGLTYYYLRQYDQTFTTLSQAVDPETLVAKVPITSERSRIEIINHQALASLKRAKKEKELSIALWKAGVQGAQALRSEQRFTEAQTAFEVMEGLWPDDRGIDELRDLLDHW